VAINGGYFEKDFAPVGLYVVDGTTISPSARRAPLSAVLGIDAAGAVHIEPSGTTVAYPNAIQSGPLLIDPGGVLGSTATNRKWSPNARASP